MLKKEQLQQLEAAFKIQGLVAAFEAPEETDINIPEVAVLTGDELTRIRNTEYKKGKETGLEMEIKAYKEAKGLEFTGKTLDALSEALRKRSMEEATTTDNQSETLHADLLKVRAAYETLKDTLTEKEQAAAAATADKELYRTIPTLGEHAPDVSVVVDLMRLKGYDFKVEAGILIPYKDGEAIKDNEANPIAAKDVVTTFAREAKLLAEPIPIPTGRGGGDGKPTPIFTRQSEVKEYFRAQGKSLNGQEYVNTVSSYALNEGFDMNA